MKQITDTSGFSLLANEAGYDPRARAPCWPSVPAASTIWARTSRALAGGVGMLQRRMVRESPTRPASHD